MGDIDLRANRGFKYRCEECDFNCIKKYDYERHLSTRKHKINSSDIENGQNEGNNAYVCHCGNIYKHQSGLYRHRKNCNQTSSQESTIKEDTDKYEIDNTDVNERESRIQAINNRPKRKDDGNGGKYG